MQNFSTARELLYFLKKEKGFNITAPIDIDDIAKLLEIKIEYIYDLDTDIVASISSDMNTATIKINKPKNDYEPRRRFSIAHEIGHYYKHLFKTKGSFEDTPKNMNRSESYWNIQESEANAFAAQLLMPEYLIIEEGTKLLEKHKANSDGKLIESNFFIDKMSEIFQVSNLAMKYRLKNLGILS